MRACLCAACLLLLWQQAGVCAGRGTYFDPSTSDGSFAAGHTNTHTHNTPCPAPNRAWRGAFEWRGVRLLFVLGIYYLISLCGRLSGRLKHCSKGSQMHIHTHTYTRTARVVWWWWCESVQATRTKTMYREREREIDRCLSVCVMWSIYNIYM